MSKRRQQERNGAEAVVVWTTLGRLGAGQGRPCHALWKSKRLMNIVSEISGKMDWDFDVVHVVRGEKAQNKELWPHLDDDTSPDALVCYLMMIHHQMALIHADQASDVTCSFRAATFISFF
ncbi:hypothetical protein Droror1_Dr00022218 [Drosera rotundifolia]